MTNSARLSGRPSSSAAYNVGDVVDTPDSAIKSWRYLGAGEWEPNDAVRYTMSPGGGVGLLVGDNNVLRREMLISAFPLPKMRAIFDPMRCSIGAITKPGSVTATIVDAPGEMYGRAIKFTLPAGLAAQIINIPVLAVDGQYPRALPKIEVRIKCSNWSALTRGHFRVYETTGTTGYGWMIVNDFNSKCFWSLKGAANAAWDDQWRTMVLTPYRLSTNIGANSPWDEASPEYTVQAVGLVFSTNAECTIELNRVSSPEWASGAVITQLDGGYALSYAPVFEAFRRRGWRGVVSRVVADNAEYMSEAQYLAVRDAGWDLCQHVHKYGGVNGLDGTVTADDLRAALASWSWMADARGYTTSSPGRRTAANYQNASPSALGDAAMIYRECGVLGARGLISDATFGYDPADATVDTTNMNTPWCGGWNPAFGRHNRGFLDAGNGATVSARNTYAGSDLHKMVSRCRAGTDLGWTYIHRVQQFDGAAYPQAGNNGGDFVRDFIADIERGGVVPITATEADFLTYERPGDIYLDRLGVWRSRLTGQIAL